MLDTADEHSVRRRRRSMSKAGRIALACTLGLIALLGLIGYVALVQIGLGDRRDGGTRAAAAWPDDEAKAFAVAFTWALLDSPASDQGIEDRGAALGAMVAPGVDVQRLNPVSSGTRQRVLAAWPAFASQDARCQQRHVCSGDVVVAVRTSLRRVVRTDYWTVPVARDARGGVVVAAYPAPTSPPRKATVQAASDVALDQAEAAPITALLGRFLAAYLRGGRIAPEFLAPGVSIVPLGHRYRLDEITAITLDGDSGASTALRRRVVVVLEATDTATDTLITARYRATVVYSADGRWLVQSLGTRRSS